MLTVKTISSSSKGNCYKLTSGTGDFILLECGVPITTIKKALNFKVSSAVGCLVSHGHL